MHSREDRLQQFKERPRRNIEAVQYSETNRTYIKTLVEGSFDQSSDERPPRIFFTNGVYPHGTFIVMGEWLVRGDDCMFRVLGDDFFRKTYYQEVDD